MPTVDGWWLSLQTCKSSFLDWCKQSSYLCYSFVAAWLLHFPALCVSHLYQADSSFKPSSLLCFQFSCLLCSLKRNLLVAATQVPQDSTTLVCPVCMLQNMGSRLINGCRSKSCAVLLMSFLSHLKKWVLSVVAGYLNQVSHKHPEGCGAWQEYQTLLIQDLVLVTVRQGRNCLLFISLLTFSVIAPCTSRTSLNL